METANVLRLSREFEASIIYVKHEFDCSRIKSDIEHGFRVSALNSGLRQNELEKIIPDDVLKYFQTAAKAFAIVSSLTALDQSPKLGLKPFVIELGYNDIRKQLWDKVLQQFKVPSGIVELFRLSYSPVIMQDGSIILPVTKEELAMNPKEFIFTSFNFSNIARVYSSALAASTRANVFDAIPMVYQHISKGYHVDDVFDEKYEFFVDKPRVDKAIADYVKAILSNKKLTGDALKVRDVLTDHDIDFSNLEDKSTLSSLIEYDWFKNSLYQSRKKRVLVSPATDVASEDITSDLFLPDGYEDLINSGQVFGVFSKIDTIQQQLINADIDGKDLVEIAPELITGGVNLEDVSDIPMLIDKALLRYRVEHYDYSIVADWWFKTLSESK